MNNFFERLKVIKLDQAERQKLRGELVSYIKTHPIREDLTSRHTGQRSSIGLLTRLREVIPMPTLIIALIIAVSGGTAVAAEGALPGDALYPIKVNVNEKVRTALAFSGEAKTDVAINLAQRRLEETERLSVEGRLTSEELQAHLEERFEAQTERAQALITRLESEGRLEAAAHLSANLDAMLAAHEDILTRLAVGEEIDSEAKVHLGPILMKVRHRMQNAMEHRAEIEARVSAEGRAQADVQAAAEGRREATVKKIAEVQAFIDRMRAEVSAEAVARAEARLVQANELLAQGDEALVAGEFQGAFRLFQEAHFTAQEAKLFLQASEHLRIEFRPTQPESDTETEADAQVDVDIDENGASLEGRGQLRLRLGQ